MSGPSVNSTAHLQSSKLHIASQFVVFIFFCQVTLCQGENFLIDLLSVSSPSPSRDHMVILQGSARILQKPPILQDLAEKRLSCKTWQKNGYLARFLQVRSGRAVLLLTLIHATHFILTRNLLKNQLRVFQEKQ